MNNNKINGKMTDREYISSIEKKVWKTLKEITQIQKKIEEQLHSTGGKLNKFIGNSGNYWGKLGENLVSGALVKRLQERGIRKINRVVENAKKGNLEYDIIAVNGTEVVIVEVKASLSKNDVSKFTHNIKKFKDNWPEYKDKKIYGAIAYLLKTTKLANEHAEQKGLFVVKATGDVIIKNKESFKPVAFA